MQSDVKFQEPFSYNYLGVIFLVLLVVALLTYFIVKLIMNRPKKIENVFFKPQNIEEIKNKYLSKIDNLTNEFNNQKISERRAYNELSSLIRTFTFETTNIDVRKYTLNDIKTLKMNNLTKLVEEYYEPEFSKEGKGDFLSSVEKTKGVIVKWK